MNEYYLEIKALIETYEVNHKVRALRDNSEKLQMNWHIGRLLVEAQGGSSRAKYGNELIKKWSIQLTKLYGQNYGARNLFNMRKVYQLFPKMQTLSALSWSHIVEIITLKNENERNYYINQVILNNLSVRELRDLIKSKAYDRLSYADKESIKLIDSNNSTLLTIEDMIKDPILIKIDKHIDKLNEKALHKYIISMLENKFLELGTGFALVGHEYKIKINNRTYKIDLLFFNINLNSYIVIELKTKEFKPQDIGQLELYVNYVDKNIKLSNHNKTIGILIVKRKDKYVIEYVTNKDVFITTYKLV